LNLPKVTIVKSSVKIVQHRAVITKLYVYKRTSLTNLWELLPEDVRNPVPTEVQAQKAQNQRRINRFSKKKKKSSSQLKI
jgi:hypothetical protein